MYRPERRGVAIALKILLGTFAICIVATVGCAVAPENIDRTSSQGQPAHDQTPIGTSPPTLAVSPTPTRVPLPDPIPARTFGCPSSACPSTLAFAVNGCTCGSEVYDASRVDAVYCCASGFSNEECPESLRDMARLQSLFGSTEEEVMSHLVEVKLQGWHVWVHEKVVAAFEQVDRDLSGVSYEITEPIGGFNWEYVPERSVLSLHAYGIAVDINPSTNPSCGVSRTCDCFNELITDMPPAFVRAFKDAGCDWGGDWQEHPDPMHFEWNGWRGP